MSVGDDPGEDVRAFKCRADDPGIAAGDRAHAVEDVGDGMHAGLKSRKRLKIGGGAVPHRQLNARRHQGDHVLGAHDLRGHGHVSDDPALFHDVREIGVRDPADVVLRVEAFVQRIDERPLKVHARTDPGVVGLEDIYGLKGPGGDLALRGDQRGHKRRGAVLRLVSAHGLERLRRRLIGKRHAVAAVDEQIDKPRRHMHAV